MLFREIFSLKQGKLVVKKVTGYQWGERKGKVKRTRRKHTVAEHKCLTPSLMFYKYYLIFSTKLRGNRLPEVNFPKVTQLVS